jgi:cytochrome c biogenesis protein CcmG, thiol:disulfide interchange protein DsbE
VKNKKIFIIGAVVATVALVGIFVTGLVLSSQPGKRPMSGSPAPDFMINPYKDYQAGLPSSVKLSDLRGKVVILNFWASWCVECRKESDALEAIWRTYRDQGVVVLGVDYLDNEIPAYEYLKSYNTTYLVGVDLQEKISHQYRITGVPETFFIDKNGIVRKTVIQALTKQELDSTVQALLNE